MNPDPHFNAKQQANSNKKLLRAKVLCQSLVVDAFFEAEKNIVRKCFFSSEK